MNSLVPDVPVVWDDSEATPAGAFTKTFKATKYSDAGFGQPLVCIAAFANTINGEPPYGSEDVISFWRTNWKYDGWWLFMITHSQSNTHYLHWKSWDEGIVWDDLIHVRWKQEADDVLNCLVERGHEGAKKLLPYIETWMFTMHDEFWEPQGRECWEERKATYPSVYTEQPA